MIKRRETTETKVGNITLGSAFPVAIQSMTKVFTTDEQACIAQIEALAAAGCSLVRLAVPTKKDTESFARIVPQVRIPLVADIHFSADRAIEAIEGGAAKIRLNPGNVKDHSDILRIIDAAKAHGTAIRVGINEASIRDLKAEDVAPEQRTEHMINEMNGYIRIFEERGFSNLVLSAKSVDTIRTIEVNRAIAANFKYPMHLGLTHAGLPEDALIPSSVALGTLLAEGIGDTLRVSIAGDPVEEARIGSEILSSLGLYETGRPHLTVCPTCGRTQVDVVALAKTIRKGLEQVHAPIKVAVMGCIVNGPGEAADADVAVCAAKGKGYIYRHGEKLATVDEENLVDAMLEQIDILLKEGK